MTAESAWSKSWEGKNCKAIIGSQESTNEMRMNNANKEGIILRRI
jgi:hypothetical protein